MSPRFKKQIAISQSAHADETYHFFDRRFISDNLESFPFGELSLTEGAMLIVNGKKKREKKKERKK